ncbi:MAG: FAD-dependent oxidoreductase, partial [Clostridia bacterium]|nr:FAD-dependent oxidoreductase [Clostridia bacterium]
MPDSAQVVVIGGGCVGAGVLWDLTLRGVEALLIEQGDLANGATGRCHGLLHSGGRYAVTDPDSAKECIQENYIIRRIAAHCVEDTGGFFVELDQDDPTYTDLWVKSCQEVGIPAEEVSKEEFLATEPLASPRVRRAFRVPDASIDPFRLVQSHVQSAEKLGGRWLTYTRVTGFLMKNSRVAGVEVQDTRTGEKKHIYCDLIVNAAGAWADQIGSLAGIHIPIVPNKGTLLVFHHRFVNHCLNRLRPPSDGDVFVPVGSVVLLGTTSINVPAPEGYTIEPEEVQKILAIGSEMIPYLKSAR